jgi:DNA-binding MarR family transcriptional regulator
VGRKYKLPSGTWIEREMMQSKAFINLKGFAPQLLILILAKRYFRLQGKKGKQKRICTNHDSINFTYIEAKKEYGVTQPRFTRAIDELLAKGFISVKHQGGTYKQDKTIFSLSEKWRLWHTDTVFEKREKDELHRGFRNRKKQKSHT